VGDLRDVCNDSFARFKADRLAGLPEKNGKRRPVKPATVNRALEVAVTILNRAARVWRSGGRPWLSTPPLIEMLDEEATRKKPRPITWAEQNLLLPGLPAHLERMCLFTINTGARDENVCGLRWAWERTVPDVGRSVFVVPAAEFKGKRDHVLILNDVAWRIVESQPGKHAEFVFVYRRERRVNLAKAPTMPYRRIQTMNNTAFQRRRAELGLKGVRIHDLRHTYATRLKAAGIHKEDRDLLLGHASGDMSELYGDAEIARLVDLANQVNQTRDRATLRRVVNG